MQTIRPELTSGLLQIGQKLAKWQWRHNFPTWRRRQVFLMLFCFSCQDYLLLQVSISSLVLELWQFSFIRDWLGIRKSEIPPRLGWVKGTNFGKNVPNEMFLNAAKCQGFSFYRFWVIKGTVMKIEKALINNRLRVLKVCHYL